MGVSNELKVGDLVRILVDEPRGALLSSGEVVEIRGIDRDGDLVVPAKLPYDCWYLSPEDEGDLWERVTEEEEQEAKDWEQVFEEEGWEAVYSVTNPSRKQLPLYSGLLSYFPRALKAVAHCSYIGNEQHNPGEPLHWSREKSNDHRDCLVRHLLESGTDDEDGIPHSVKVAWRALATAELEMEERGLFK